MKTLLFIPTEFEWNAVSWPPLPSGVRRVFCGLGPIESGVRAMGAIHDFRPDRVVLGGLAGTYDESTCAVGAAYRFGMASCWGIGAGEGACHVSAQDLGWRKYDPEGLGGEPIAFDPASTLRLITTCASANDARETARRIDRYPNSAGEDMETYSVALACLRTGSPLTVFRGISNRAGDRELDNWCVERAMASVRDLVMGWLSGN